MPSARCWCDELSLEVGEALSLAGLELLELGVAMCSEVEGAMVAYVLDGPGVSRDGGACGAVTGGAATAVVMVLGALTGMCIRSDR